MKSIRLKIKFFFARYLRYYQFFHQLIIPFLKKKNSPKVFCVGYVKTGTTSLNKALNILGYRSVRLLNGCIEPQEGWIEYIKKCNYDAFTDYPMFEGNLFQKIDVAYPNSKFILTERDLESWKKSYQHFYQTSIKTVEKESKIFKNHNKIVKQYFKEKPHQLLILRISKGDGWEKLCRFLNKPIPNKPFPHKNKGKYISV